MTCASTTTTLIADAASKDEIDMRIAQLKKELSESDSVYDTEKLSERIAKLSGGVAVIKVRESRRRRRSMMGPVSNKRMTTVLLLL